MEPTSKQLHNYVGTAFDLAARNHCLRKKRNSRGERWWGMIFPPLVGVEESATGDMLETVRRLSLRIGRYGYSGWSLTVFDVSESIWPGRSPAKELMVTDGRPEKASLFSGGTAPYVALRSIYKIRWTNRWGIDIASKRLTVHTHENEVDGRLQADAFLAQFEDLQELLIAEMDGASVTKYDVDFMRNELQAHVEATTAAN